MTPMVEAQDVHKSFGTTEVLCGVDMAVQPGEVACVIGPSGSGKSTFLRCVNHLERINAGTMRVDGELVGYREANGAHVSRAVAGGVVLNAHQIGRLANGFGRGYTWGEVIMHELGHVMGLAHTSARRQIMSPHVTRRRATWGAGDLAGLRRVGDRHGCLHRSASQSSRGLDRLSRQ